MNKWLLVTSLAASASATCYYPDGSNAAKDYKYEPCGNSTTTYSTCCYFGEGDKCLPNGLCNQPDRFDYRAACQNKDWSNCPEICMDTDSGTWYALQECGKNKYCCPPADGSDCCKSGAVITTLAAPSPGGDTDTDADTNSESSSESESGTAAAGAADATRTGSSAAATSSSPSDDKGGAPIGAIVGGVVGGIAVIAILAVVGFFFFRRRGKKPATSPEGTVVVEGGAGSSASNSSDISKEKAAAYKQPQSGVAEVEGTAGNVYTEADSTAISKARFNVRQEANEEAGIAAGEQKNETYYSTASQKEQQRFAEVEGSRGNVYSEADSQAISKARFDAWRQAEEVSRFSHQQEKPTIKPVVSPTASPNLAEIAGSPGNVYTEADSQPVAHTHSTIVSHVSSGLSSTTSTPSINQSSINHSAFHSAYASPVNSHGHMTSLPYDTTLHQLDQHTYSSETKPTASQPSVNLPGIQTFTETENTGTTFAESVSQAINHPHGTTIHHTSSAELSSPETKPGLHLPDIQASGGSLWDVYASSANAETSQPATKINHANFAEAEGSAGTVFTEADSHAISKPQPTSFQLLGDNTFTSTTYHMEHQNSFTETIESPVIVSTESHSHTTSIPQSTTVTTTTTTQGIGGDAPSSSNKPTPSQVGQESFVEAEGSPGNVYTEVDSQPFGNPRPGNQAEEHVLAGSEAVNESSTHHTHQHHNSSVGEATTSVYTEVVSHSTNQEKPTTQKPSEPSVVEVEGSTGNRYTEADSQPINPTRIEKQHSQQTQITSGDNSLTMQQRLDLAEIEGSASKLFLEADSTAISPARSEDATPAGNKSTTNITQLSLPEIEGSQGTIFVEADSQILEWTREEPKTITQQTSTLTEVEGTPGNVYSEADSKVINQSQTKENTVELDTPQLKLVEIEGSAGNVYSEADSKTVNAERREEASTRTETKGTHELL
ncbi:hypothetical protein N0V84_007354 [Fusarium piperis]|uniref:Uncharacterized protein n=1 Tax=Fusarium piperis TaxID=1435070 RepID=A0A9W9BNH1_9HYPO|nr:hypothetical protein N0V84_007354 [Fusarium piperis]